MASPSCSKLLLWGLLTLSLAGINGWVVSPTARQGTPLSARRSSHSGKSNIHTTSSPSSTSSSSGSRSPSSLTSMSSSKRNTGPAALRSTVLLQAKAAFVEDEGEENWGEGRGVLEGHRVGIDLVKGDAALYSGLALLQALPLISLSREADLLYFGVMAVATVYLGSKRQAIPELRASLSSKQAALAPVVSSVSLFGLYLLLKNTDFNPGTFYQAVTTLFSVTAITTVGGQLLGAVLPNNAGMKAVELPSFLGFLSDEPEDPVPLSSVIAGVIGVGMAAVYLNPAIDLHQKFLISNIMAWCIGVQSIGLVQIKSYATAAVLLMGLFCYDIYWVFGTDVMMSVATKIEAPVKLTYPILDTTRAYPYAILGLGDIVIPAFFSSLMWQFDRANELDAEAARKERAAKLLATSKQATFATASPFSSLASLFGGGSKAASSTAAAAAAAAADVAAATAGSDDESAGGTSNKSNKKKLKYFESSVLAYALALSVCFAVNNYTKSGQPALLYLSPAALLSALATSLINGGGELQKLLSFQQADLDAEGRPVVMVVEEEG